MMRRQRRHRKAESLTELLVALALLGLLLSAVFSLLANGFLAAENLRRMDAEQYRAQWSANHSSEAGEQP